MCGILSLSGSFVLTLCVGKFWSCCLCFSASVEVVLWWKWKKNYWQLELRGLCSAVWSHHLKPVEGCVWNKAESNPSSSSALPCCLRCHTHTCEFSGKNPVIFSIRQLICQIFSCVPLWHGFGPHNSTLHLPVIYVMAEEHDIGFSC